MARLEAIIQRFMSNPSSTVVCAIDGNWCDSGHGCITMGKWLQQFKVYMNESYIPALLEVRFTAVQFVLSVGEQENHYNFS